mgnify:CR=1 FL=1
MKAVVYREYAPDDDYAKILKVEDIDSPKPKPDEVIFTNKASALNYNDIWGMRGNPVPVPLPHVSGSDVAGDVIAVGDDVKGFKVVGFADFGLYGNSNLALINLKDAQSFFEGELDGKVKLRLSVDDIVNAKPIAEQVRNIYPMVEVVSWDEAQSSLFTALNLEKILTSIMLIMIIVIGAVNIISTLVMVVSNKSSDIAILRTLGATKSMIMKIFVVQGMISGILGTLLGVFFGTVFALYAPSISQIGENIVNQFVIGGDMYFISHLRTQVNSYEVMAIGAVAILISFFATLYPAYRASKIYPAEVLRYE